MSTAVVPPGGSIVIKQTTSVVVTRERCGTTIVQPQNAPGAVVRGIAGPPGPPGPAGPAGPGGGSAYTHTQSIAAAVWTAPHNLGRFPSVSVVDTAGNKVEPDVQWVDSNIVQITHGSARTGKAYFN